MQVSDFLKLYFLDPTVLTVGARLNPATRHSLRPAATPEAPVRLQLRGLVGSQDAVLAAALHHEHPERPHLFILHDRDEAAYFLADLQHLLPDEEPLLFPSSYKRPYSFDETENANVLMRAEVLNRLNTQRTRAHPQPAAPKAGEPAAKSPGEPHAPRSPKERGEG